MATYRSQDKELGGNIIDYSAMHNWNSSKISEARQRAKGDYGTPRFKGEHQEEREVAIGKMNLAYGT